ncbi:recT family protein, partial [Escherichia coli 3.4870]
MMHGTNYGSASSP